MSRVKASGGRSRKGRAEPPTIRFYPNDPDAPVGLESVTPVEPDPSEPSFTIEGRRYAPAPYDPGTLAFQYWQGEVALARTIRVWEDLFERDAGQLGVRAGRLRRAERLQGHIRELRREPE